MIKEFIYSVISVAFLSVVCEMIIPEGSMKKYYKLTMGFIIMCILFKSLNYTNIYQEFEFSLDEELSEQELLAESDAYILKIHEENIKKEVQRICGEECLVFVELYSDGNIKSISINGEVSDENIAQMKENFGCDNIVRIKGGEYNETN